MADKVQIDRAQFMMGLAVLETLVYHMRQAAGGKATTLLDTESVKEGGKEDVESVSCVRIGQGEEQGAQ